MPTTTLAWLESLDDDQLVTLLAARPDLAVPAPSDFATLANRVNTAPSIWRALELVDLFGIEVLTALVVLRADRHPAGRDAIVAFLGSAAPSGKLTETIGRLADLGLIRGDAELSIPYPVVEALGPHPTGLGAESGLSNEDVEALLADTDERGMGVLRALAMGPPVGSMSANSSIAPVVAALVGRRLLVRKDATLVELPREVGLVMRGSAPLGELHPDPVHPKPARPGVSSVDRTAAGQALQVLRELTGLIDALTAVAAPALKSGGLGVRETRRLTKDLGIDDATLSLYLELLAAANLITVGDGQRLGGGFWTPTSNADSWLASPDESAWAFIAGHWLDMRREPARAGTPDPNGKALNLLGPELSWLRGPAERRWVLATSAELPAGSAWSAADLAAVLAWRSPIRGADRRTRVVASVIREATAIGVVAFDALTTAGRALLAGDELPAVAAIAAKSLPDPVRQVLIQADLTVVAPGRLVPELAEELAVAADVESAGSATVYRVTPQSIRRALDRGRSAAELHRLFADHSTTPVPQALDYLINDIARKHGVLRAGIVSSYLRCDDPVLIDQAISIAATAGIVLRRLAPTVAISSTETDELLVELRKGGLVPVAEDEFGAIVSLQPPRRATPGLITHQRWREPAAPSAEQLSVLVERMRSAGDGTTPDQTAAETAAALREAVAHRRPVWIEYVNAEGASGRRLVEPIAMSGGTVAAFDKLSNQMRSFALHRISSVLPGDARPGR